jgi:hypothetical protein
MKTVTKKGRHTPDKTSLGESLMKKMGKQSLFLESILEV